MSNGHKIRVKIADDHNLVVQVLYSMLKAPIDFEMAGPSISSGRELLSSIERDRPGVLLLDVHMPDCDALGNLSQLSERLPQLRVLIVTALRDRLVPLGPQ